MKTTTHKEIESYNNISVEFNMSAVSFQKEDGTQLIIDNDNFQLLVGEFLRRQREIKKEGKYN